MSIVCCVKASTRGITEQQSPSFNNNRTRRTHSQCQASYLRLALLLFLRLQAGPWAVLHLLQRTNDAEEGVGV